MNTLSLHQPHASLVAIGAKPIETRSWKPPGSLIGDRIAIHAAKKPPTEDQEVGDFVVHKMAGGSWAMRRGPLLMRPIWYPLPLGAILCTARLVDCVPVIGEDEDSGLAPLSGSGWHSYVRNHPDGQYGAAPGLWLIGYNNLTSGNPTRIEDQRPYGDYRPGRWAWLLDGIEALANPVPFTGRQGLVASWEPA
jgi:hypothetical protein